jgi:glycine oxidase
MSLPLKPIRGQIVLLECARPPLRRIANLGARYLVPREDGRLLIGSTEEDVGFDKSTTGQGIQELLQFALELVPALREARFQRSWAGLRPATADGMPYLGPMPEWDNLFIAAGHFRSGLTLSAGTAVAMGALIRGQTPPIDLDAFKVNRK